MRAVVCCLSLLLCASLARAQDTKELADHAMRLLRERHFDGTGYGDGVTTCRVLDALRRSPRRYNELDGPFFRRPAEHVAARTDIPPAWRALALAGTIGPRLREARDEALDQLALDAGPPTYERLLAWRTLAPDRLDWDSVPVLADDAALRCLVARDPASVEAPPVDEPRAWVRWARAAVLRGVVPVVAPPLPEIREDATVDELVEALDLVIAVHALPASPSSTADRFTGPPPRADPARTLDDALRAAWDYLRGEQSDGTFGLGLPGWEGPEAGVTALCLSASIALCDALDAPRPDWIDDGLDHLVGLQRDDGSIHDTGLAVYTTSVAIGALLDGGRASDRPAIERARRFLLVVQADEGEGYSSLEDPHYGGIGYGGDNRPDLSNTWFALEAATRAGTPSSSALYPKALQFLARNQNDAESARFEWPRPDGGVVVTGTDGGATYMPGNSPAGEERIDEGVYVARSYGSMTYALTRSYMLCGLEPDDRRLAAALRWLGEHFTLERNPGFAEADAADGLYYYYLAMATTLDALPDGSLRRADDRPIAWREELVRHLVAEQRTTGCWMNERAPRWWESSPTLCTAYAALALTAARD